MGRRSTHWFSLKILSFLVHYLFVFIKLQKNICFVLDPFFIVCCLIFHNASELPEERRCGAPRLFVPAEIGRVVALIQCDTMIQIMGKTLFCLKSLRLKASETPRQPRPGVSV